MRRLSVAAAVLGVLAARARAAEAPVRASGVESCYCSADVEAVGLTVESLSAKPLLVSFSVEKRASDGTWAEYWDDIYGSEQHPLKVRAVRLKERESLTLTWTVRLLGVNFLLGAGRYRLVATVSDSHAEATHHVVGAFSVDEEGCARATAPSR